MRNVILCVVGSAIVVGVFALFAAMVCAIIASNEHSHFYAVWGWRSFFLSGFCAALAVCSGIAAGEFE